MQMPRNIAVEATHKNASTPDDDPARAQQMRRWDFADCSESRRSVSHVVVLTVTQSLFIAAKVVGCWMRQTQISWRSLPAFSLLIRKLLARQESKRLLALKLICFRSLKPLNKKIYAVTGGVTSFHNDIVDFFHNGPEEAYRYITRLWR